MCKVLKQSAITMTDFYKICHKAMYPEKMTKLYSTWTPRSNQYFPYTDKVVWFGLQGLIQTQLQEVFQRDFFALPIEAVVADFKLIVGRCFDERVTTEHIEALHKLGYLPIRIKALPEGTRVPINTPMMTLENTHPEFAWVTNYLETLISQNLWSPTTTATISDVFHQKISAYLDRCGEDTALAKSLYGDFSPRGMSSSQSSAVGGAGHLLRSIKTSSIESIRYLSAYYGADVTQETVGEWSASVEHSCTCTNYFLNDGDESVFFRKLLCEVYADRAFTYVADSFDFWGFVTEILPTFKDIICTREHAKVAIRPDSGDPELILCGDKEGATLFEQKGLVEVMWDLFGGTVNDKGYKKLDPHIGIVYGDSITIERCEAICERLIEKGFVVNNVVFGVGSYTYNMISRDTLGHALKATYCEIDGQPLQIYKAPKTDVDATKKSRKGKVAVVKRDGKLYTIDELDGTSEQEISDNLLQTVYENGIVKKVDTLDQIRRRLDANA